DAGPEARTFTSDLADDQIEDAEEAEVQVLLELVTTSDNWATAREFLAPPLQRSWRPSAGVSIDAGPEARTFTSDLADDQIEDAEEAEVQVLLELV
ncbi:hypothetical protein CTI14_62475, partial [Methylobacterium radiotolerans]